MSPSEVALGGFILIGAIIALLVFNSMNTRHHSPDDDELNLTHDEEVHPDSLDR